MRVRITIKGNLNGVHYVWSEKAPTGAIIEEIIFVLQPTDGFKLRKKGTKEFLDFVILKDGIKEEDYEEVEIEYAD